MLTYSNATNPCSKLRAVLTVFKVEFLFSFQMNFPHKLIRQSSVFLLFWLICVSFLNNFLSLYAFLCAVRPHRAMWPWPWCESLLLKRQASGLALGTSLDVHWSRLHAFTASSMDSTPGWGTKIPHAAAKNKKEERKLLELNRNENTTYQLFFF